MEKKYSELALTTSRFLKKINLGFPHVECFFFPSSFSLSCADKDKINDINADAYLSLFFFFFFNDCLIERSVQFDWRLPNILSLQTPNR